MLARGKLVSGKEVSHISKACCVNLAGQTGAQALLGQITPSQWPFWFLFKPKISCQYPKDEFRGGPPNFLFPLMWPH